MSWHFSQALEEEYLVANCSAGKPSAPSNMTTTPAVSSWPDKMTDASIPSLSGTMCEPSMESHGVDWWTSSLADSRAKTSAWQGQAKDLMAQKADSGKRWPASLAKWDHASYSWKTRQLLLFSGEPESLETLPRWGMMRGGELWADATPALPTIESAYGSWPTLSANEARNGWQDRTGATKGKQESLTTVLQREMGRKTGEEWTGGHLNPAWAEWFMGWPIGHTDCDAPATDRFRQWCASHGISSDRP